MEPPIDAEKSSPSFKRVISLTLTGFLIGLIAIVAVLALVLRFNVLAGIPQANSSIPSPDCGAPTLVLANTTFQLKNIRRGADGSLPVPPEPSGIAYWIEGTEDHPVFVLPPTSQNLAVVSTINLGSMATATWPDCRVTSYPISVHEPGSFHSSDLPDQSQKGMTVFFPIDASGAGFVFTADLTGEPAFVSNRPTAAVQSTRPVSSANTMSPSVENTLPVSAVDTVVPSIKNTLPPSDVNTTVPPSVENTFPPDAENMVPTSELIIPTVDSGERSVEISFSDNPLTIFETSIRIEILISNHGKSALTLSETNVSLTQSDSTPLAMQSSEPSLPEEIQPGETKTFQFVFPRPTSSTSTLKILTVEYDVQVD